MKVLKQSIVIILTMAAIFTIVNTQLSDYIAQILAMLIIFAIIFIVIKRRRNKNQELFVGSNLEFCAITSAILLLIFLTDGLYSNVFFLVYFLLFGVSFMFEPPTVFVFLLGLLALFSQQALQDNVFQNMVQLGSLVLLSPIAFFFGREFKRREKLEKDIEEKSRKILNEVDALKNKEDGISEGKVLDDIEKQAKNLSEEAKND